MSDFSKLGNDFPDIVIHGAEAAAPAAGTVLADTTPVPRGGNWRFKCWIGTDESTKVNLMEVAHRNATNNADIEVVCANCGSDGTFPLDVFFNMGTNERVVVRNKAAGGAAQNYQANIHGWLLL